MGLCAQAADERGRAGWNAEGERRKTRKERQKKGMKGEIKRGWREKEPEGKATL